MQPWKGHDLFLKAIGMVRDRGTAVRAVIVGGEAHGFSGGYQLEVEALIQSLRLTDCVTVTGQVPDARPEMQAFDLLVNASDREPFGITLIEAMAEGLPVVAFRGGGPDEIIDEGVTGLLVDSRTPEALADALIYLLERPVLRRDLGTEARRVVEARFSAKASAEAITTHLASYAKAP
jgi:glycosyltransferase involved in cell wall biosynthesis